MHTKHATQVVNRADTLREMRKLGYSSDLRRKWWQATTYLRTKQIWVLDGAPAKWGEGIVMQASRRA